jgi:hypothetical protein
MKSLEGQLLQSKKFAQTVGNILIVFWLAITKKEVAKEMM